jgi:hypothetical protein
MSPILSAFNTAPKQKIGTISKVNFIKDSIMSDSEKIMRNDPEYLSSILKKIGVTSLNDFTYNIDSGLDFARSMLNKMIESGFAVKKKVGSSVFYCHVDNEHILKKRFK